MRSFPQPRHSRYHWPFAPRRRCQRWSRSLHRQGLAIAASSGIGHTGSSNADPRLTSAISPGPEAWAELALDSGNDDQGDAERGPVASSTSDATVRDAGEACRVFRSVVSVLVRAWETFLYTLKAGPAGGRLRRPSSAGTDQYERRLPGVRWTTSAFVQT